MNPKTETQARARGLLFQGLSRSGRSNQRVRAGLLPGHALDPDLCGRPRGPLMRQRRSQRGQELVELGITTVLFMIVALGVLMFGHAFMVVNMVTHAARDGARLAASWADRGACQQINNDTQIKQAVNDRIATVTAARFTVNVGQNPPVTSSSPPCANPGSTPTVTVNVNGCVPYLFNILGFSSAGCSGGFKVNRNVTFDDELRATFGG